MKKLVGALALALIVGVACGGDEEQTSAEPSATSSAPESLVPEPTGSLEDFATELETVANAAGTGDCDAVDEFNAENDAYQFFCGGDAKPLAGTTVTGSEAYGPAGVVDHTSEGTGPSTFLVYVDADGEWRLAQDLATGEATVGTPEDDLEGRTETLERAIDAVIDEDCDVFFELWITQTPDKEKECRAAFEEGTFQEELAADPDAEPRHFGGNNWVSFFGLTTEGKHYRTMMTLPTEPGATEYVVDSLRIK